MGQFTGNKKKTDKIGKPQNEAQRLASAENWAILQLKNIDGQTKKLAYDGFLWSDRADIIEIYVDMAIREIKAKQAQRKLEREMKHNG